MADLVIRPIGVYRSAQVYPYEAARQPREDSEMLGEIELEEGRDFEQALRGLEGLERIWLVFQFDRNENWKPMVRPPRGAAQKIGVFATRAPYRPNPLGLSCVRLIEVRGRKLTVKGADLLDGTPIFDLKPYLPEADAFPGSRVAWLDGIDRLRWDIAWSALADEQCRWLEDRGGLATIRSFVNQQLEFEPFDEDRKRVSALPDSVSFVLAYRTWRFLFTVEGEQRLRVAKIYSGYSTEDLTLLAPDKWADKSLHRDFIGSWPAEHVTR